MGPQIKIDQDVYKLKDGKVSMLLSGRLSVEAFAMLVSPDDPYVLVDDTIYALTESEYYALRRTAGYSGGSEADFRRMLDMRDLSFMSAADAAFMSKVRGELPRCPACRYRKYRDAVLQLMKKYGVQEDRPPDGGAVAHLYPDVDGEVRPAVTGLLAVGFGAPAAERKPCMDCVEKHIAQAWVLSSECAQGYPEYIALVRGHLGEAIDELPAAMTALRDTLVFCLAMTNYTGRPFVPIWLVMPLVNDARGKLGLDAGDPADDAVPVEPSLLRIDVDGDVRAELAGLPGDAAARLAASCAAIDKIIPRVENPGDLAAVEWEGAMGALADRLAGAAPRAANMLRARRLMFKADPRLAAAAGFMASDLLVDMPELGHRNDAGGRV